MNKKTFLTFVTFVLIAMNINAQTWTVLNSGTSEGLFAIHAATTSDVYAVGNATGANGIVLKSINQGASFTSQSLGSMGNRSIYFSSPTNGYIGSGSPGTLLSYIFKTTNSGTSWSQQLNINPNGIYDVHFPSLTTGYAVGGDNIASTIFKSTNGGNTWVSQSPGTTQCLFSVCFTDTLTGYAVGGSSGQGAMILKTINGGTTWTTQSPGTTNILRSVWFPANDTGYAVGHNGTVLKTTNGGVNWSLIPVSGVTTNLHATYFINVMHGFAVGAGGVIIETQDGGLTWSKYLGITSQDLLGLHFINQNLGYACGLNGTIIKYTAPINTCQETIYTYDTIVHNDTIHTEVFDTVYFEQYNYINIYDTISVYDTIHIAVTDTLIIDLATGLPLPNNINTLLLYPNPTSDHLYIDTGNYGLLPGYSIKITNSLSQIVFQNPINQPLFNLDLSTWTGSGTYYVYILDWLGNVKDTRTLILL